jgi:hypothetical protein
LFQKPVAAHEHAAAVAQQKQDWKLDFSLDQIRSEFDAGPGRLQLAFARCQLFPLREYEKQLVLNGRELPCTEFSKCVFPKPLV